MSEKYDEDYFINGRASGKSLYKDYKWLPKLTIPMAESIIGHCDIDYKHSILDFGCARGYLVKAMRLLGYEAYGCDTSKWAIDNCDVEVANYLSHSPTDDAIWMPKTYDWIIAKDVLEHIEYVHQYINMMLDVATKGVFVVVPLSKFDNGCYVVHDYELDKTHVQRYTLKTWVNMFLHPDWRVEASYRVTGVKDNYYTKEWERANGFIKCTRISR